MLIDRSHGVVCILWSYRRIVSFLASIFLIQILHIHVEALHGIWQKREKCPTTWAVVGLDKWRRQHCSRWVLGHAPSEQFLSQIFCLVAEINKKKTSSASAWLWPGLDSKPFLLGQTVGHINHWAMDLIRNINTWIKHQDTAMRCSLHGTSTSSPLGWGLPSLWMAFKKHAVQENSIPVSSELLHCHMKGKDLILG